MLERIRDMLRSAATSRTLTRGIKAYREGDFASARTAVDEVVAATEPRGSRTQETHRRSMRLMAVALRAEIAAKQGDDAVTRAAIEEGFALWADHEAHPVAIGVRSVEAYRSWEKWARGWLERQGKPGAS
jgi:hypothetical protein